MLFATVSALFGQDPQTQRTHIHRFTTLCFAHSHITPVQCFVYSLTLTQLLTLLTLTHTLLHLHSPTSHRILIVVSTNEYRVLWINMREEPLIYINKRPFVLREVDHPMINVTSYAGM